MPRIQTGSQREQQFFKGVEVESAEHPWLSAREVERLVNDHLDEDPRHYSRPQENPANVKKFLGAPDVCDICHKLFVELPGSPTLPRQEAFANAVVSVLQNASYDAWSESAWD